MRLSKPLFNRFMICVPKSVPFATMANRKQHDKGSGIFSLISLISLHLCYRLLLSNNISLSLSDPSLCHTKSHILFESHRKFIKCQCVDESGSACNKDTTKPIATYELLFDSIVSTNQLSINPQCIILGTEKDIQQIRMPSYNYFTCSCSTSFNNSIAISSLGSFVPSSPRKALASIEVLICSICSSWFSIKLRAFESLLK